MQFIYLAQQTTKHEGSTSSERDRRIIPQKLPDSRAKLVVANRNDAFVKTERKPDQRASICPERAVALGETLTLELVEGLAMAGQVIWTSGSDCGVKFDRHIDCRELLTRLVALSQSGIGHPDSPQASSSAVTRGRSGKPNDLMADISRSEMKPVHDGNFVEGLAVKVLMSSGPDRRGIVCWTQDNIARLIVLDKTAGELGSTRMIVKE